MKALIERLARGRRIRKDITVLVFAGIVTILVGCVAGCVNRTDAQKLADSGLSAASTLAAYYGTLSQQVDDIFEMEAFSNSLRGIPRDPNYEKLVQDNQAALLRRARLARQLAASYQSLKDLSSYDASGSVSDSFDKLGKAVTGSLPPLKGLGASAAGAPIDAEKLFSTVAGWLASWKQSKDLQKAVRGMTETLTALDKLFAQELPACQSISEERVLKASVIASELIQKKQVNAWPLLQQDLDGIGLKLAHPDTPPTDDDINKALAQVVRARSVHLQGLADSAGQDLLTALNQQLAAQERFQANQGISVTDIQTAVEKASDLLGQIENQKLPRNNSMLRTTSVSGVFALNDCFSDHPDCQGPIENCAANSNDHGS
jgi:hypothetical protein